MVVLISLLTLFFGITLASEYRCLPNENCVCYAGNEFYQYNCPYDPLFTVELRLGESVEIICINRTLINWTNENIPNIGAGDIKTFRLQNCPIPSNFEQFMKKLGIKSIKTLKVSSGGDKTLSFSHFEGLENLDALILSHFYYIDEDAFKNLVNLTDLQLDSNYLQVLEPKMFQNLKKLKRLDLSGNKLANLSEVIFENLPELESLHLFGNKLTEIPSGLLRNLRSLSKLDLSFNDLVDLPEDFLQGASKLERLILEENKLKSVPEDIFQNSTSLECIKLNGNPLGDLPKFLFSNLQNLKEVNLKNCNLKIIPNNLFSGSKNLENISLASNKIDYISEETFNGLENLLNLDLSFNKFERLTSESFISFQKLRVLNLGHNLLNDFDQNTFGKLYKLEKLYLNDNKLEKITNRLFGNLGSLKEIYLSNNHLDFPEKFLDIYSLNFLQNYVPFNTNTELEIIDLRNNNITVLSDDLIINKIKLKSLDLSFNNIKSLSIESLITASGIPKTVNLENNKISVVHFQVANLLQGFSESSSSNANARTTVLLNDNPINCDCNVYDFAKYFDKTIDPVVHNFVLLQADNLRCASPRKFRGVPVQNLQSKQLTCSLDKDDVEFCPKECHCEYRRYDETLIVNCSRRNLTVAPNLRSPKERSYRNREVYLGNNLLTEGPKENMGYDNVTTLVLSNNSINELTWMPPDIKVLKLDNNNISHLSTAFLMKLNSSYITNLTLGGNDWMCDCSATDLLSYLVSHLATVHIDANKIFCKNIGSNLISLDTSNLCPISQLNTYILSAMSITIIILICLCVVLYHRNEHEIKVWLFAHNMLLWFVTEEEIDRDKLYDAFISYSHKDEEFVLNEIQSVLEKGPNPYKLCLHIRDFLPGEAIAKQIVESVEKSRRTLVILSPHFLESVWATMEFRTAHTQAMSEGRARVIVVLYGDIDVNTHLDEELKAYIKTNTYVKWNDPWFWDKLKYALPHSQKNAYIKKSQKNKNLMIRLNDKLELINTIPTTPNPGTTPPVISLDPLLLKNHPLNFSNVPNFEPPVKSNNPLVIGSQL